LGEGGEPAARCLPREIISVCSELFGLRLHKGKEWGKGGRGENSGVEVMQQKKGDPLTRQLRSCKRGSGFPCDRVIEEAQ